MLLAVSVHCAIRAAVVEARKQLERWGATEGTESDFMLDVPATLPVVKRLCGLNYVETYLQSLLQTTSPNHRSFIYRAADFFMRSR